jgi:hypothetical protein
MSSGQRGNCTEALLHTKARHLLQSVGHPLNSTTGMAGIAAAADVSCQA